MSASKVLVSQPSDVPFKDDSIQAIRQTDGTVGVVIKRICDNFGLSFPAQFRKLKQAAWARVAEIAIRDSAGRSQMTCVLDLDCLPMWMVTIKPGKVAPENREKLVAYQAEARDVLARHFLGEPAAPVARPWSIRFRETLAPHVTALSREFRGSCFTIASAQVPFFLSLEDQIIRHMLHPGTNDRPDGSLGQCWANYRRSIGLGDPVGLVGLRLPDQEIEVMLRVYPNIERGVFDPWFFDTYVREKLPAYLDNKPSLRSEQPIVRASIAENVCLQWSGRPAILKPKARQQLKAVGGFAPAGTVAPQIEGPRPPMFDFFGQG